MSILFLLVQLFLYGYCLIAKMKMKSMFCVYNVLACASVDVFKSCTKAHSLFHRIFQPDPPNYHCPYQQNNSCTWISLDGKNSFKFGRHYKIFVVAYNNLTATVSNANQVDTNKIGRVFYSRSSHHNQAIHSSPNYFNFWERMSKRARDCKRVQQYHRSTMEL